MSRLRRLFHPWIVLPNSSPIFLTFSNDHWSSNRIALSEWINLKALYQSKLDTGLLFVGSWIAILIEGSFPSMGNIASPSMTNEYGISWGRVGMVVLAAHRASCSLSIYTFFLSTKFFTIVHKVLLKALARPLVGTMYRDKCTALMWYSTYKPCKDALMNGCIIYRDCLGSAEFVYDVELDELRYSLTGESRNQIVSA